MDYLKRLCVVFFFFVAAKSPAKVEAQTVLSAPVLRSCYEILLAGYSTDGIYYIDPDNGGPIAKFLVYCDLTGNDAGTTHVRHDQMDLTNVTPDTVGVTVTLTYDNAVTLPQMEALISASQSCKQYMLLDCENVRIYDHNDASPGTDSALTYWFNRAGDQMDNWGTASGVRGCQCLYDGDCVGTATGQPRCNCDAGLGAQSDSGYITEHDDLPVTALYIDEVTTTTTRASYRVSSLQCDGSVQTLYPNCDALKEAGILLIDGEYLVDPDGPEYGEEPSIVRCEAETGNTIIVHTRPGDNNVPQGPGTAGYYVIEPDYANDISTDQLARLVETSEECWQWLSLSCKSARIFDDAGNPVTWWVANDGRNQLNWASPEGAVGCSCSQNFEVDLTGLTVSQSSTLTNGEAENAIDGNSNPSFAAGFCQSTQTGANPEWWTVDLGQVYCINHVTLRNTNENPQYLAGTWVTVGDDTNYKDNDRCRAPLESTEVYAAGGEVTVLCEEQVCGRYVTLLNADNYLRVCEVKVYAYQIFPHEVIPLSQLDASQSSVMSDGEAELAIDGNSDPDFYTGESCILTEAEDDSGQWWAVDLKEFTCVSRVVIKNRQDCCYNQLTGATVRVGTNSMYGQNAQCGVAVTAGQSTAGSEVEILCDPPVCGTYLSVHKDEGYLTFCEIYAWSPIPHDEAIPLQGLSVDQLTDLNDPLTGDAGADGIAELAIDGDDNPTYGTSCTHTERNGDDPWWAVDLGEFQGKCISRVLIKNRDVESDRLIGAVVRVGDSDDYDDNPQCGWAIAEEQSKPAATITVWCWPPRCGRYISIHQEYHEDMILSLCEVWAFKTLPVPSLGTCDMDEDLCSCDANDDIERWDGGYVREQGALPIHEVRVGDIVEATDSAVINIGPLICEGHDVPVLRTCQELYLARYEYSGIYEIDPDGEYGQAPFYVYCDMSDNGGTTHIVNENNTPTWVEEGSQLILDIDYGAVTLDQMQALIDASVFCKQWLRLDCYNYEIWSGQTSQTWWMNKDLERRENWGTDTGVAGCDCSTTNDCTDSQPRCSCDRNFAAWDVDEGYIEDKTQLPIRRVVSGTASVNEKAKVTVGPLQCTGVDECANNLDRCHPLAVCADTDEAYTCTCIEGYEGSGYNCDDIDECAGDNNCAQDRATCTNTEGSYTCECNDGYTGDGQTCDLITECAETCDDNALCQLVDGWYICVCNSGYEGDGTDCDDINECQEETDNCLRNAICANTYGGFNCLCSAGYTGSGTEASPCIDIDECALNTDDCGSDGFCVNVQGTFGCQCNPGFYGSGKECVDVDECAENLDNCNEFATCTNIDGGFVCECLDNFRGDGRYCVDINECAESRDDCSDYATCINTDGGYGCECWEDYIGDGRQCIPPPTKEPPLLTTEAIIGIAIAGAGLLLLLLIICCCCFLFATHGRSPPAAVAPPPERAPQPFIEQPPPPPAQYVRAPPSPVVIRAPPQQVQYVRAPQTQYVAATRAREPSFYGAPPNRQFIRASNYATGLVRGDNFNSNNSTDQPSTAKQVFFNPGFVGREDEANSN